MNRKRILLIEPVYFFQKWPLQLNITKYYFYIQPLSLLQLAGYRPKDTMIIDGLNDFNETPKKLAEKLIQFNYSDCVIGIGSHSNVGAINVFYTLRLVKSYAPKATVILGGYQATFFHKKWMTLGADIIIRNEGEISYSIIIDKILNGEVIKEEFLLGCTYSLEWFNRINKYSSKNKFQSSYYLQDPKKWRKIFKQPICLKNTEYKIAPDRPFCSNLDDFPIPARYLIDFSKGFIPLPGKGYSTAIETSRGCPFQCEFCSTQIMWKKKQRYKSVQKIIEEIKSCLKLGITKYVFVDESWGINRKREQEFLDALRRENISITWGIQIRVDTIIKNPDLIRAAGEAGCRFALVGFETLDQEILDYCKKGTKISQYVEAHRILKQSNIVTFGYFITGIPGEKIETRKKTMKYIDALAEIYFFQPFIPYFSKVFHDKKEFYDSFNNEIEKNGIFNVDIKNLKKYAETEWQQKNTLTLIRDLRNDFIKFIFNIKNLKHLIIAKNQIEEVIQTLLRFFYRNLFTFLFRFKPQDLLTLVFGSNHPLYS